MNQQQSIFSQSTTMAIATVGINVDIESLDAAASGQAGLFGRYSYGRYGLREGIARLLKALAEVQVGATFYVPVADLQRHPELAVRLQEAGHEIAVRGRVDKNASAEQQLEAIGEEYAEMTRLLGSAPSGWRAIDGVVTQHTLPALARTGYVYDASFCDDDQPYALGNASGDRLIELPTMDYLADAIFYAQRHTHARVRKVWKEEAEAQIAAGALVHLTLHTRGDLGSTRLPRIEVMAEFLRWLQRKPGVTVHRAGDLARQVLAGNTFEPFPLAPVPQI